MSFTQKKRLIVIVILVILPFALFALLEASENKTCRPYTEKELSLIRGSNNPNLIMGSGVVDLLINQKSAIGRELLGLGSRIESPKGIATVSLVINHLNQDLPLKPLRKTISQFLHDDKNNALSYYLNALLQEEEGNNQESLTQIKKGNTRIFNGYPKKRFHAIVKAGEMADCKKITIQRHALLNSLSTIVYIKARHLCQKLIERNGQEGQNACFLMGENLERASLTIVEKLNSLAIQKIALDGSTTNAVALNEIKNRRELALSCNGRKSGWEWIGEDKVPEDIDLKYTEIYLESGECAALEFLSDYLNRKE